MTSLPKPAQLVFKILGPLEVSGPSGPVRIPPGRQEMILASLLLEANRIVSTDHLVDLIWDEEPPETARTQVQICVSRLRKSFTDAGIDASLATRPPGYILQTAEDQLDLNVFHGRVAEARVLIKEGRNAEAAELLRAAVALWRGRCLSGISSETLRTKALRLDEDRLTAIETYLDLELELGRHHQLVAEIGWLVHEHPLRERLRGQLMLALYRSGRQAEALETYRAGRDLLIEELGLEPGEELRLLETAILSGDTALLLERGPARRPADSDPGPAPAAVMPYREEKPHQLPADTADFIGRESLIQSMETALLSRAGHRAVGVVVVVGKPGVGKSTLATHVAHRLGEEHFPDGQLYCDMRGTRSEPMAAKEVLGRFLRALGIPGPMLPDDMDERAEMYRTLLANRRVLVVLDDAASEGQVMPLLPGRSGCAVLVTSRARLTALPGAHRVELDILDTDQALELLGRVIGLERVAREPDAARALLNTVGGLPLALRIIAARLAARPHWTLASMVHRLANERHRLDELTHGEMTMRASLSLTHDGLGRDERRLLRLLSLAEGPTMPGWLAGALLDDHRPFPSDLLEPLVDVQMLDVVAVERSGEFRYRFHEIIRLFAREQLIAHDSEEVQRAALERMIGGWLAIVEQAHRKIYGGDFTVLSGHAPRWFPPSSYVEQMLQDPLEWLDSEQANLCSAVAQAATAQLDELSWDLATRLVTLFEARGYHDQWEQTHRQALEAVRRAGNKRGTAALLTSLGTLYISRRQPQESKAALDAALALFEELGDAHGLALCRRDLALLQRQQGADDDALTLYNQSMRDFEQAGDIVGKAIVLTQSAHILMRRGDTHAAHTQLEEALEIYRSVGYVGGEAQALRRVGQVLAQRGEHEEAERTLTEVLEMVRRTGDVIGQGHLLHNLGEVNAEMGRVEQARGFFDQALAIREQIMDHGGAAVVRLGLASLLQRTGDRAGAGALLEEAIATFRERDMACEMREAERLLGLVSGD
ncbi:AfsR/SARP family transcriptional regulator [Allorhizocola rhizosphaerae]|uniref:AfsR/SARP family transcriptional regulator n=1 Tax=Allorhizocola rhizosphaerae TaxID=1872709 RepID=UPI001FEC3E3E|nr:AfsR/SARP family transcriptional regulator [Allorhizocola rhizosphaerae]